MITKFTTECFGMKKMTCGHLLSASLVKKILAEKDIKLHDMTLSMRRRPGRYQGTNKFCRYNFFEISTAVNIEVSISLPINLT